MLVPTLLQQIAAGDQAAVARCLDEYGGLVWGLASKYLSGSDRSEIEDAVQEVFVSIWLSAARYDPAKGGEPAFVATITHRRLNDHRRKSMTRRRDRAAFIEAKEPSRLTQTTLPTRQDLEGLGEEFARLPEDERTALWMAVTRGLSHREIANGTNAPIGTVKSRLRRAVLRMQRALGVETPDSTSVGGVA